MCNQNGSKLISRKAVGNDSGCGWTLEVVVREWAGVKLNVEVAGREKQAPRRPLHWRLLNMKIPGYQQFEILKPPCLAPTIIPRSKSLKSSPLCHLVQLKLLTMLL